MEVFTNLVATLGFPIAVACFALWNSHQHEKYLQGVLETTLKENTKAIDRLSDLIDGGLMWVSNNHVEKSKHYFDTVGEVKGGSDNEDVSKWH